MYRQTAIYDGNGNVSAFNWLAGGTATFSLPPGAATHGHDITLRTADKVCGDGQIQADGSAHITTNNLDVGDHRITYTLTDPADPESASKVSPACDTAALIVDQLSPTRTEAQSQPKYLSISTGGLRLASREPTADQASASGLTDIRVWADSFKVRQGDGNVDPLAFPDDDFAPGKIRFFSAIRADDEDGGHELAPFDYFPRLGGVPIFVTGISTFQVTYNEDTKSAVVQKVVFVAVPINPDEVAAETDDADLSTILGIIVRARSRKSVLKIQVKPGDDEPVKILADSRIDWVFSVNRQRPTPDPQPGIPGRLARLVSKRDTITFNNDDFRLAFKIDPTESRALVFGRLWPLQEDFEATLHGHGSFVRMPLENDPVIWRQRAFTFRTDDEAASGEVLADLIKLPTSADVADNPDLRAIDDAPFAWDTAGPDAGRYFVFGKGNEVLIADRTTGLADAASSALFFRSVADADVTSTAIIEDGLSAIVAVGRQGGIVINAPHIEFLTDPTFFLRTTRHHLHPIAGARRDGILQILPCHHVSCCVAAI